MSFKEKSIWISLVLTVLIFGFYFVFAFTGTQKLSVEDTAAKTAGIFIGVIIVVIILEIVLHTVLAISSRKETLQVEDERDKLIELKGSRFSYFVLAAGVWIVGFSLFFTSNPVLMANILLLFFIFAEVVKFASQLYLYRRGL